MKAAFIVVTCVAAAMPVIVPAAGANVLGLVEPSTIGSRGGVLTAVATLAWAMIGVRLIKS